MATPYWGQLPGPKVLKNPQRADDDVSAQKDPRNSFTAPPKHDRSSVQTVNTESTTFGTFPASPSTVDPHGLAPRPASFQRRPNRDSAGGSYRRSGRRSHDLADFQELPTVSAAPAPAPSSAEYQHPYGNGGLPYTHPISGMAQSSRAGPSAPDNGSGYDGAQAGHGTISREGAQRTVGAPEDYRASGALPAAAGSGRRRDYANDRSPLQRLEGTLDSMTKEEKRARVQAAEQRARARAARKASGQGPSSQDVSMDARIAEPAAMPTTTTTGQRSVSGPSLGTMQIQKGASHRGAPVSSRHPDGREYVEAPQRVSSQKLTKPRPNADAPIQKPERNLSFRERTGRDDGVDFAQDPGHASSSRNFSEPSSSAGFALARNGSNKLRKEPPGDPWYSQRTEVERAAASRRVPSNGMPPQNLGLEHQPSVDSFNEPPVAARSSQPTQWTQVGSAARDSPDVPIHASTKSRQSTMAPAAPHAIERRPVHQEDQVGRIPPAAAVIPAHRGQDEEYDDDDDDESSIDVDQPRRRKNLATVLGEEGSIHVETSLYQQPQWLDEWRQATVGTLSGALLDLSEGQIPGPDKNSPWWEGSGRRRGNSISQRARHAEAFDGEYDEGGESKRCVLSSSRVADARNSTYEVQASSLYEVWSSGPLLRSAT